MNIGINYKKYFSHERDDWETPHELFTKLNDEFHFTLDPCASEETAKCPRFFTKNDNGLSKTWYGERVFMNPPYGRVIKDWIKKATMEKAMTVALIPVRTDTEWWHEHVMKSKEIRFIRGRLRFVGASSNAPFPNAIVIFDNLDGREKAKAATMSSLVTKSNALSVTNESNVTGNSYTVTSEGNI